MPNRALSQATAGRPPVFALACWVLGLTAFSQMLVAGLALGARQVRVVEKEVVKLVRVEVPVKVPDATAGVISRLPASAASELPAESVLPTPSPLQVPPVADPRAEQLLKEARQARVADDMGLAILKLEEARGMAPDDPSVLFELGLTHEAMGVFDTAADYYDRIFKMGSDGAGALYKRAADKIRDGFQADTQLGKLSLGRVRIFNDPNHEKGQRVVLSIPVQKAPDAEIELNNLEVAVEFFNRNNRDGITALEDKSWVSQQWVSEPFDWADGEETLRMNYLIPRDDLATEHLFGELAYYGQVVTLLYNGEVLDVQAWPRDLAARSRQKAGNAPGTDNPPDAPEFLDGSDLPPDFDPNLPMVLPPR